MNREQLWDLFVKRNPKFLTGPIAFQPETLRKFFDTVWDQSQKFQKSQKEKNNDSKKKIDDDGLELLNKLFGQDKTNKN